MWEEYFYDYEPQAANKREQQFYLKI